MNYGFTPWCWVLLFLLVLIPQETRALTPLICTTRADAVAVVAAACQLAVDCRFELGTGTGALTLGTWDVFLTEQTQLLSDSATGVLPLDARKYFWPENYITLPLMAYDDTSMAAVDCSVIASNPQTDLTDAVFMLLDTINKYLRYVSQTGQCADVNELALWNNDTGTPTIVCQCAPGKVCTMGNTLQDGLMNVVGIMVLIMALGVFLFVVITGPIMIVQAQRLSAQTEVLRLELEALRHQKQEVEEDEEGEEGIKLESKGFLFGQEARSRATNNNNMNNLNVGLSLMNSKLLFDNEIEMTAM